MISAGKEPSPVQASVPAFQRQCTPLGFEDVIVGPFRFDVDEPDFLNHEFTFECDGTDFFSSDGDDSATIEVGSGAVNISLSNQAYFNNRIFVGKYGDIFQGDLEKKETLMLALDVLRCARDKFSAPFQRWALVRNIAILEEQLENDGKISCQSKPGFERISVLVDGNFYDGICPIAMESRRVFCTSYDPSCHYYVSPTGVVGPIWRGNRPNTFEKHGLALGVVDAAVKHNSSQPYLKVLRDFMAQASNDPGTLPPPKLSGTTR